MAAVGGDVRWPRVRHDEWTVDETAARRESTQQPSGTREGGATKGRREAVLQGMFVKFSAGGGW